MIWTHTFPTLVADATNNYHVIPVENRVTHQLTDIATDSTAGGVALDGSRFIPVLMWPLARGCILRFDTNATSDSGDNLTLVVHTEAL